MTQTKEEKRLYMKEWRERNKEHVKEYEANRLAKRKADPEKDKAFRAQQKATADKPENKARKKINDAKSFQLRKPHYNEWVRNRKKTNPQFKLSVLLRNRLLSILKSQGIKKTESAMELLGCTVEVLREHLESTFKPGMTWENHSFEGWHIDHIKAIANFDLEDLEQRKKCFHYTNLQAMWAKENMKKGKK